MTQGTQPDGAPLGQPWAVTGSLVWAVAVSLVLLSVGALSGRPDVALLGVAPLLASLSATWLRPRGQVWADSAQSETIAGVLAQRVQLSAPPGCTAVRLRLGRPEHGFSEVLVHVPPFLPGDSIRQVDWKVTARRSPNLEQLYVRRTMALGEAAVVLVVDSRDDVGPDGPDAAPRRRVRPDDATSLDLARQAAMTVAEGYLAVGDRVAVEDLGVRRRGLRPGTGRRQLDRVVQQLALLRPEGDPRRRIRPPRVSAGSLVYVFSTFLDAEAADMARAWRRMGQGVIAVDVLPNVRTRGLDARQWLAIRLIRMASHCRASR